MRMEKVKTIREISNCKKNDRHKKLLIEIKLGDYRIGLFYEKGIIELTTVYKIETDI